MRAIVYWLALISSLSFAAAPEKTVVTIYAYHSAPPYVTNLKEQKGINYALIRAMQQNAEEHIEYRYEYLPRPALNQRLTENKPTIILWANPLWFEKTQPYQYLWSGAIFGDKDVIVTRKGSDVKYRHLEDLTGLKLGTRKGYYYHTIDKLFTNNQLQRIDSTSDLANIKQLIEAKVDAIIITKSSLLYYVKAHTLINKLSIVGTHSSYKRHMLLTTHYQDHLAALNKALSAVDKTAKWHEEISFYGLQDLLRNES